MYGRLKCSSYEQKKKNKYFAGEFIKHRITILGNF